MSQVFNKSQGVLTKSQLLGEHLKRELSAGALAIGSRFYSVQEVSDRFNVSLATAHMVVAGLVKSGYLRSQRGKGYFLESRPQNRELHPIFKQSKVSKILFVNIHTNPPAQILTSVQDVCEENHYRLEIINLTAPNFLDIANEEGVAGLIINTYPADSPIGRVNKPKISIGHWQYPADNVLSFIADAEQASIDAVKYLCGLRHERIGLLLAQDDEGITDAFASQTIAGLRRGYQLYGLNWSDDLLYVSSTSRHEQMVRHFIETYRQRRITALFIGSWQPLAYLCHQFLQRGLRFPADLSVIAYGEHPISRYIHPSITHFCLFIPQITRRATELLIHHDQGVQELPQQRYVIFPAELHPGESTGFNPQIDELG